MKLSSSNQLKAQKFTDFTIMFRLFPHNINYVLVVIGEYYDRPPSPVLLLGASAREEN